MPLIDTTTGAQVSNTKTANFNPANFQWLIDGGAIVQDTDPQGLKFVAPAPTVSITTFKLLFGAALPGILAAKATDANLQALFYIIDDPRTTSVDLSLKTVQTQLDYLLSNGLIDAALKAEILTGVVA